MSTKDSPDKNTGDSGVAPNPDCEMPDCVGSPDDDTKPVRDPSNSLVEMCEGCLGDGWRGVVEVLE